MKCSMVIGILLLCSVAASASVLGPLGQVHIPGLTKNSLNLAGEPLTVDDIVAYVAQHLNEVKGDLCVAGHITKKLSLRLLNYIKENPVNASIIAGGIVCIYLLTSTLIKSMTATRCPCCSRTRQGHGNYIYHV